jgi:hypothetical protein
MIIDFDPATGRIRFRAIAQAATARLAAGSLHAFTTRLATRIMAMPIWQCMDISSYK